MFTAEGRCSSRMSTEGLPRHDASHMRRAEQLAHMRFLRSDSDTVCSKLLSCWGLRDGKKGNSGKAWCPIARCAHCLSSGMPV